MDAAQSPERRRRWSASGVLALLAVTRSPWLAGVALLLAGGCWLAVLSTLNALAQLVVPGWVRARGLAAYMVVFFAGQSLGGVLWGVVADLSSLPVALLLSAGLLAATGLSVTRWGLHDIGSVDPTPSPPIWPEPNLVLHADPDAGPVLVMTEYTVAPDRAGEFVAAMSKVARSRQRTGGRSWSLFQDGARPTRFVETYLVPSWSEHLRQHSERLTVTDVRLEQAATALTSAPPVVSHLFVPDSPEPG
jgi:MFS family permease